MRSKERATKDVVENVEWHGVVVYIYQLALNLLTSPTTSNPLMIRVLRTGKWVTGTASLVEEWQGNTYAIPIVHVDKLL